MHSLTGLIMTELPTCCAVLVELPSNRCQGLQKSTDEDLASRISEVGGGVLSFGMFHFTSAG